MVSITQGVLNSLKPEQSQDFRQVSIWLTTWLSDGVSPYHLPEGFTANYPPHAIAFLSPLALIPKEISALIWSLFNVALAPIAGFAAVKIVKPDATWKAALLPCLLFLSWAGLRVGLGDGQFSLLMLTFGLLALVNADKRPYLAATLLALSLMKPHIGAAFFLWALLTKRFRVALGALAVLLTGLLLFSLRVAENPLFVTRDFLSVLRHQFGGATFLPGVLELRPLVHLFIGNYTLAETVHLTLLLALLVTICVVALRRSALTRRQRDVVILQLSCLWVSMSVFHNPYDTVLLLPVMVGLWAMPAPHPGASRRWRDQLALWFLQVALVLELPGIWWKLEQRADVSRFAWAGWLMTNFDRVLIFCLFVYLAHRAWLYLGFARRGLETERALAQTSATSG